MNFPQAIISAFKNYANFSGRASRSEYWYFYLFLVLAYIAIKQLDQFLSTPIFEIIFVFVTFVPLLALAVRRLHDINRSGWWYLIEFVPLGFILLIVWACKKGTNGRNNFGANPLELEIAK